MENAKKFGLILYQSGKKENNKYKSKTKKNVFFFYIRETLGYEKKLQFEDHTVWTLGLGSNQHCTLSFQPLEPYIKES